jgi:TolB-like protein/AraC-like DNA-binding protein
MSRSNLLRKVKKLTNLSVSQLISQVRLQRGMELLGKGALNVSEVSHQVGFSSTSYFIKCFREYYGYPPGEVGKKAEAELISKPTGTLAEGMADKKRNLAITGLIALVVVLAVGFLAYYFWPNKRLAPIEKSIAVLPFINDSNDSTNLYLINGLMESTLNNLQQIKELKVISRTSAEKYRNTSRSIPEIAKELNVNYIVEGSGQKMGDRIVLNIQLIEASTDRHLWGNQYRKESKDIFELQREVANSIAQEIQAIITPDERSRIEKKPTDDLEAYDLFLKGQDHLSKGGTEDLKKAVSYFDQATARDPDFAVAYARAVTAFYYLDAFQKEKKYTNELSRHADKALLYDSKNAESLIAKGLDYMNQKQYSSAVPYLEKALEYNPNSSSAIGMLADFYCNYVPNTARYLEYALKGVRLENASKDSASTSLNYLRLGNAFIQNGFVDEGLKYIDVSLEYNPKNPFSRWVRAFVLYAKNGDLSKTIALLKEEYKRDSTRFDILQDIGKMNFYMRDYKAAYESDKMFRLIRETRKLDIYKNENLRMAVVAAMMGEKEKAEELAKSFKDYADNDHSIYKPLSLGVYYCYRGDYKKSLEYLNLFLKEENYQYWIVLFIDKDPILDPLKDNAEYKRIIAAIKKKFADGHNEIRKALVEKGLI